MNFLKAHWKLFLGGIIVLIILVWIGSITGMNSKLYKMALDNLRHDQTKVVETLEQQEAAYEQELLRLQSELERIKSQQAVIKAENDKLKGKVSELQNQRQNVIVSSDPDTLVRNLHDLGIGSARRNLRVNP